jgi:hypothetical protein
MRSFVENFNDGGQEYRPPKLPFAWLASKQPSFAANGK